MSSEEKDAKHRRNNWLKVSLALHYTKEGLERFCDGRARAFHQHLCSNLEKAYGSGFTLTACTTCDSSGFKKHKNTWKTHCNICDKWLTELLKEHAATSRPTVAWVNTDPRMWGSDPWEVAKVFQPHGCHGNRGAADSDSAGLLTLMSNCKFFHQFHKNTSLVEKVKAIRNTIMHCSNVLVTDTERDDFILRMLDLLDNIRNIPNVEQEERASADEAYEKINKLWQNQVEVVLDRQQESLALRENMADVREKLTSCQQKIDNLHSGINDVVGLKDDLEKTKAEMSKMKTFVEECSQRLDTMAALTSQTTKIDSLEQSLQRVKQRINYLSGKLEADTSLREPKPSTSRNQDDDNREGVHSCLACHTAKDLPQANPHVSVLKKDVLDKQFLLDKLYVKPNMKLVAPDFGHGSTYQTSSSVLKEKVESYREVFFTDGDPVTNIYIIGEAGVGKSTLCEHMVNLWCRSKDPTHNEEMSEDESAMSDFTILFYISLRESVAQRPASDNDNVEGMIKHQLGVSSRFDVGRILEEEKCLIILDGLDEWTPKSDRPSSRFESKDLPRSPYVGSFTIVTTSRPWKLEVLREELAGRVDKQVIITGLGPKGVVDLVNNVINMLNADVGNKRPEDFFKELRSKNLDLQKILETPVLLLQLVCLWNDDKPLDASLVELYSNMIIRQLILSKDKPLLQHPEKPPGQLELPSCLRVKVNQACPNYAGLLKSLSALAFSAFLSQCRETSLVFDHKETEIHGMCDADVERCLRIGLLTQSIVFGKITEENKRVSFIHKTFQEFFAAAYIATFAPTLGIEKLLPEDRCTLDLVLEMEKVFVFVSGMNAEVSKGLITYILKQVNTNKTIQAYRKSIERASDPTVEFILRLQGLILDCCQEAIGNGMSVCLPIDDLAVCSDCDIDVVSRVRKLWDKLDTQHVKSIVMVTPSDCPDNKRDIQEIFQCAIGSDSLERIYVFDWGSCIDPSSLFDTIDHAKSTLKSVALLNIDISSLEKRFCDVMRSLSLEAFGLEGYGHGWGSTMTHEQLSCLSDALAQNSPLKRLRIEETYCGAHRDCQFDIQLSQHQHLEELYLDNVYVSRVRVDNVAELRMCEIRYLHVPGASRALFSCLKGATKLHHLIARGFNKVSDFQALLDVLPYLTSLQRLSFGVAHFKDIIGEQFTIKLPPALANIDLIMIKSMSFTNSCLRDFVDSLPRRMLEVRLANIVLKQDTNTDLQDIFSYIRVSGMFVVRQNAEVGWFCFSPRLDALPYQTSVANKKYFD